MNARSEFSKARIASKSDEQGSIRVWDPVVRLFHWTVVAGCAINLIVEEGNKFHRAVGYVVAAAVAVRVLWGFVGAGHARFTDFVPTPAALVGYLRRLFSRLWCIAGSFELNEAFSCAQLFLMRVPSPIRPCATSHGADGHARTRTVPYECGERARCRRS
jgi:hypothetical protein